EDTFPPMERDNNDAIVHWVLRSDLGSERKVCLLDGTTFSYALDSRYFILSLANRAIGLGFLTYDYASKIIYGNYIAVQEYWRAGNMARAFFEEMMWVEGELFPENRGVALEVEKFDLLRVEQIIDHLERHKEFTTEDDKNEVRKFLRILWYQQLG